MCYWELMWTYSYQQDWVQAFRYADLLCKESRWSKVSRMLDGSWNTRSGVDSHLCSCLQAIYVYQKAAILSMMSGEEQKKTGEDVVELFRSEGTPEPGRHL